jgi:membrane protein implicated in regulation of membrane protease activity
MQNTGDNQNDPKANMLGLLKVMEWSLFLALGVLAALIGSAKELFEDHSLQFGVWTLLAPAIVLVLNWLFWRHVRRRVEREDFDSPEPRRPR